MIGVLKGFERGILRRTFIKLLSIGKVSFLFGKVGAVEVLVSQKMVSEEVIGQKEGYCFLEKEVFDRKLNSITYYFYFVIIQVFFCSSDHIASSEHFLVAKDKPCWFRSTFCRGCFFRPISLNNGEKHLEVYSN